MEDITIKFEEDCISVAHGQTRITLNTECYTPSNAICYALNELGITEFSEDLTKSNLDSVDYYKKQIEELNKLLSESLKLSRDLILKNEKLNNVGLKAMLYGRK